MIKYISEFFDEFEFTSTERVSIAIAYEKIRERDDAYNRIVRLVDEYEKDMKFLSTVHPSEFEAISQCTGVHKDTVILITLICMTKKLRERLSGLGMSRKNVYLTLSDLIYKMHEEERTLNIVGTYKWDWFSKIFMPSIFAIGKLQFELSTYGEDDYEKDGRIIKKGSPVLKVHIPMSGEPLDEKACSASYRDARKFFTRLLGIADIPISCTSWLLSPLNKEFLGDNSNIVKFTSKYDVVKVAELEDNTAVYPWIFDVSPDTPLEKLPRNTTLRRTYAAYIEKGGKILSAHGILIVDNSKQKQKQAAVESIAEAEDNAAEMPINDTTA